MTIEELITTAEREIEQARGQEIAYAVELGRAQGTRAAHEAWRQRLAELRAAMPAAPEPSAEEPAPDLSPAEE